jgi:hypothetical protein
MYGLIWKMHILRAGACGDLGEILEMLLASVVIKDMAFIEFEFGVTHKPAQRENIVNVLVAFGRPREREREGQKEADIK